MAKFSHYCYGSLYYRVDISGTTYQFPIDTVERGPSETHDEMGLSFIDTETLLLSSDLGTTSFGAEIRGSELIRWIQMAVANGSLIKVG